MEAALKTFFSSPRFAVAGASSDPTKFGHKGNNKDQASATFHIRAFIRSRSHLQVFAWYLLHSFPVTPINPRNPTITIRSKTFQTVSSLSALPAPTETSLSIITPPVATKQILREAKEVGIPAVWLQPGSFDDETLEYARREFKAAIGGTEAGSDGVESGGEEGWCVLVDGEEGLKVAGREWERGRL